MMGSTFSMPIGIVAAGPFVVAKFKRWALRLTQTISLPVNAVLRLCVRLTQTEIYDYGISKVST